MGAILLSWSHADCSKTQRPGIYCGYSSTIEVMAKKLKEKAAKIYFTKIEFWDDAKTNIWDHGSDTSKLIARRLVLLSAPGDQKISILLIHISQESNYRIIDTNRLMRTCKERKGVIFEEVWK